MFKVISVRGNSVRVNAAGLVTFDVTVIDIKGQGIIQKPKGVYIHEKDMPRLVKVVLEAFYTANKGINENEATISA
jgi:sRNA-binding carbon storage regulator CsrA